MEILVYIVLSVDTLLWALVVGVVVTLFLRYRRAALSLAASLGGMSSLEEGSDDDTTLPSWMTPEDLLTSEEKKAE